MQARTRTPIHNYPHPLTYKQNNTNTNHTIAPYKLVMKNFFFSQEVGTRSPNKMQGIPLGLGA